MGRKQAKQINAHDTMDNHCDFCVTRVLLLAQRIISDFGECIVSANKRLWYETLSKDERTCGD